MGRAVPQVLPSRSNALERARQCHFRACGVEARCRRGRGWQRSSERQSSLRRDSSFSPGHKSCSVKSKVTSEPSFAVPVALTKVGKNVFRCSETVPWILAGSKANVTKVGGHRVNRSLWYRAEVKVNPHKGKLNLGGDIHVFVRQQVKHAICLENGAQGGAVIECACQGCFLAPGG
jgi:hypothetical protein